MKRILKPTFLISALLLGACSHMDLTSKAPKVIVPATANDVLLSAKPGDIVNLVDFPLDGLPKISYTKEVISGPQYIISDDPEYIRVPEGIALREDVMPGSVRLYVYNVNGVKEPKMDRKISAVIENRGEKPLTVSFRNYSFRAPSTNYFGVAKNGLYDYFNYPTGDSKVPDLVIPPGESRPLDEKMENSIATYDELVHGLYEFTVDQPARIFVVQTAPETPSPQAVKHIDSVLESPRKNAGRGLFPVSNYAIASKPNRPIDTENGPVQLVVADGKDDPWIQGVDSSSGKELELRGNYGVMYDMELEMKSSDGRGLAVVTWNARYNPEAWCGGMALSMKVDDGVHPAGVYQLPTNTLNTKSAPEAIVIQVYPPVPIGETRTIHLTYSPPGASCLPTPLVFVPVDLN